MIKGLIFDLDGVLVDTKDIHFQALNEALLKVNAKKLFHLKITQKTLMVCQHQKNSIFYKKGLG